MKEPMNQMDYVRVLSFIAGRDVSTDIRDEDETIVYSPSEDEFYQTYLRYTILCQHNELMALGIGFEITNHNHLLQYHILVGYIKSPKEPRIFIDSLLASLEKYNHERPFSGQYSSQPIVCRLNDRACILASHVLMRSGVRNKISTQKDETGTITIPYHGDTLSLSKLLFATQRAIEFRLDMEAMFPDLNVEFGHHEEDGISGKLMVKFYHANSKFIDQLAGINIIKSYIAKRLPTVLSLQSVDVIAMGDIAQEIIGRSYVGLFQKFFTTMNKQRVGVHGSAIPIPKLDFQISKLHSHLHFTCENPKELYCWTHSLRDVFKFPDSRKHVQLIDVDESQKRITLDIRYLMSSKYSDATKIISDQLSILFQRSYINYYAIFVTANLLDIPRDLVRIEQSRYCSSTDQNVVDIVLFGPANPNNETTQRCLDSKHEYHPFRHFFRFRNIPASEISDTITKADKIFRGPHAEIQVDSDHPLAIIIQSAASPLSETEDLIDDFFTIISDSDAYPRSREHDGRRFLDFESEDELLGALCRYLVFCSFVPKIRETIKFSFNPSLSTQYYASISLSSGKAMINHALIEHLRKINLEIPFLENKKQRSIACYLPDTIREQVLAQLTPMTRFQGGYETSYLNDPDIVWVDGHLICPENLGKTVFNASLSIELAASLKQLFPQTNVHILPDTPAAADISSKIINKAYTRIMDNQPSAWLLAEAANPNTISFQLWLNARTPNLTILKKLPCMQDLKAKWTNGIPRGRSSSEYLLIRPLTLTDMHRLCFLTYQQLLAKPFQETLTQAFSCDKLPPDSILIKTSCDLLTTSLSIRLKDNDTELFSCLLEVFNIIASQTSIHNDNEPFFRLESRSPDELTLFISNDRIPDYPSACAHIRDYLGPRIRTLFLCRLHAMEYFKTHPTLSDTDLGFNITPDNILSLSFTLKTENSHQSSVLSQYLKSYGIYDPNTEILKVSNVKLDQLEQLFWHISKAQAICKYPLGIYPLPQHAIPKLYETCRQLGLLFAFDNQIVRIGRSSSDALRLQLGEEFEQAYSHARDQLSLAQYYDLCRNPRANYNPNYVVVVMLSKHPDIVASRNDLSSIQCCDSLNTTHSDPSSQMLKVWFKDVFSFIAKVHIDDNTLTLECNSPKNAKTLAVALDELANLGIAYADCLGLPRFVAQEPKATARTKAPNAIILSLSSWRENSSDRFNKESAQQFRSELCTLLQEINERDAFIQKLNKDWKSDVIRSKHQGKGSSNQRN